MAHKVLRTLLLAILALALLCSAVQAVTLTVTVKDYESGSYLSGASVYVSGTYVGKTGSSGTFDYSHSLKSDFTLRVTKSGYEDWSDVIDYDDTSVTVRLEPDTVDLEVTVYDADTVKPISGIRVTVTAKGSGSVESERTNSAGKAVFDVDASETYTVAIDADDYESLEREVDMDGESRSVQFWLYPAGRFAFKVLDAQDHSPIAGAEISVGGTVKGVTGSEGTLATVLDQGRSYQVKVTHTSYQEYLQEVYVGEDAVVTDIFLKKATYPVFISVFDEETRPVEGAAVTVDGASAGVTDRYGRLSLGQMVGGSHTVAVKADGYTSWEGTCTPAATGADLAVELAYVPVSLSVLTENADHAALPGVSIGVNGASQGVTAADGRLALSLKPGTYNISGSREGYLTAYADRTLAVGSSGESAILTLKPEGPAPIVVGAAALLLIVLLLAGVVVTRRIRMAGRRRRPGQKSF